VSYMLKIARILIAAMLVSLSICAQEKVSSTGWDLSYKSVLEMLKENIRDLAI